MGEKLECPGCNSYTSSILTAVSNGEPCPSCGLSASAIVEIMGVRRTEADSLLKERTAELIIENGRLRTRNTKLEECISRIRYEVRELADG